MRARSALLSLILAAGCGSSAPGPRSPDGYEPPDRAWRADAPGGWRAVVDPNLGAARIVFLETDREPWRAAGLSVTRFPNIQDGESDAYAYADKLGKAWRAEPKEGRVSGRDVLELRREAPNRRRGAPAGASPLAERALLFDTPTGFYALIMSAPAAEAARVEAHFERLAGTFATRR